MDRRSFLRGSGLAAASLMGVTAFSRVASAQDKDAKAAPPQDSKQDETKAGKDEKSEQNPDKQEDKKEDKKEEQKDAKDTSSQAPDPFKETRKDDKGREFRLCPQCGFNMYRQDKTWTCENCGYSYSE